MLEKVNVWADVLGLGIWILVILVFWVADFTVRIFTGQFAHNVLGKHDVKIKTLLGEYKAKPGEELAHK
ncbi:MAG: hypothetical protein Q8M92_00380 [Candidatus Subteraquimicrobiales bacterium]|nr:hypothetical protein [Candidatus Subteraquimicrobiales bacterium]